VLIRVYFFDADSKSCEVLSFVIVSLGGVCAGHGVNVEYDAGVMVL